MITTNLDCGQERGKTDWDWPIRLISGTRFIYTGRAIICLLRSSIVTAVEADLPRTSSTHKNYIFPPIQKCQFLRPHPLFSELLISWSLPFSASLTISYCQNFKYHELRSAILACALLLSLFNLSYIYHLFPSHIQSNSKHLLQTNKIISMYTYF